MSNFYLDVLKDRLYVERADSKTRRAAQTVMYKILKALTLMISPILAFTAEEIWKYIPHSEGMNDESPLFNMMPEKVTGAADDELMAIYDRIHELRDDVKKALESARAEKLIGASLDAKVTLFAAGELKDFIIAHKNELAEAFIVSQLEVCDGEAAPENAAKGDIDGLCVLVEKATGEKCARCWMYSDTVGKNASHPDLCERCAKVLG